MPNVEDADESEAVNELGRALDEALLGASSAEVQRVIDAIAALVDVRIAQAAEFAADRLARPRA
ncbi:hypothetical protein [Rhizobium sp. GN54]|uniref:hypothetical protein n=1 Tax=Rhizobium sp. GN54 TaxID=2898150 RepID=UPI001E33194D|nr:hypothetical protein [Rhizobium sp. GN54]MCD2183322.1 hypothetical protein [Rhizobium sp. GN54]